MSGHIKAALSGYGIDLKSPGGAAAAGGAAGAVGGLLANLLRENPSLKTALRDMLVGGAVGATAGAGGSLAYGKLQGGAEEPPAPQSPPAAEAAGPRMRDIGFAGLSGYLPVTGPAIYGGVTEGPREAARLGIGSAAGTGIGALLGLLLSRGKGGPLAPGIGGVAGSMLGAGATAASDIGKSASAEALGQKIDAGVKDLGRLNISPFANTGGAAVGGLGGAALGGTAGLLQALFDSEDDGVLSTLRKALTGGAIGGIGGAAVGGIGSHVLRNRQLDKAQAAGRLGPKGQGREFADQVLRRFVVPVGPAIDKLRGKTDTEGFHGEILKANGNEALLHMLATALAPQKRTHFLDGSVTAS